jgi:ribonuclease HII
MSRPDYRHERRLLSEGCDIVAGVDEVGRGPLAGPVVAAAVVLDPRHLPKGLQDSKRLAPAAREALYEAILAKALAVGVASASAADIDRVNIRQATFLAMRGALRGLSLDPGHVLVDGNDLPPALPCPGTTIVGGDAICASIAAASIVAKVTRDRLMRRLCALHPVYGFAQHVGYGTRAHLAAIARHGPSPYHRLSFAPFRLA